MMDSTEHERRREARGLAGTGRPARWPRLRRGEVGLVRAVGGLLFTVGCLALGAWVIATRGWDVLDGVRWGRGGGGGGVVFFALLAVPIALAVVHHLVQRWEARNFPAARLVRDRERPGPR